MNNFKAKPNVIQAKPMTLGYFNQLKGVGLYKDGDPLTEGYLIVNPLTQSNHADYPNGGISWLSKNDFENQYLNYDSTPDIVKADFDEVKSRLKQLQFELQEERKVTVNSKFKADLKEVEITLLEELLKILEVRYVYSTPCDVMDYKEFNVPCIIRNVSFEHALIFAGLGYSILREGWNGKTQFVSEINGGPITTHLDSTKTLKSMLVISTLGSDVANPWSPSPTDLNAKDWVVLFNRH